MRAAVTAAAGLAAAACAAMPAPEGDAAFAGCPAYRPAYEATDRFMETFNSRDMAAFETSLHFPHVRIASGTVTVIPQAGLDRDIYPALIATGWARSGWASRRVVQCEAEKAHMLTRFVRYRADGSELAAFDSLYIVELRDGRWAVTARSSFAP
jgi:hypothetical protein